MVGVSKALSVSAHCVQCGEFNMGADVIAESQRLLAEGCRASPYECRPELLATLLPQFALESLQTDWDRLESATREPGRHISLHIWRPDAPRTNNKLDPRTIARWWDHGGYIPAKA
ncbi:MAG: hypothetical protein H6717_06185 [Polyangiaceae bacterium]|nr:hypothetical protein [Polyangiaceae bacterium]MCB9609734.1 hypothetical protein [Polyangiaceae bacterium]